MFYCSWLLWGFPNNGVESLEVKSVKTNVTVFDSREVMGEYVEMGYHRRHILVPALISHSPRET